MKAKSQEIRISHSGEPLLHNMESAPAGAASQVVNLREREDALEVVGEPAVVAQGVAGDRVLLVDDDRVLLLRAGKVMWGDVVVLDCDDSVMAAHAVGALVVITTGGENRLLLRTATGYEPLRLADAIPQIHLAAVESQDVTWQLPAMTFDAPYNTWQAPLNATDLQRLAALVRSSMASIATEASRQGRYTGVMLARYGVRLWDDSYLWLSPPVMVGHEVVKSSYRATTTVTVSGGAYAGIEATTLSQGSYRLGISVASGVAASWQGLVKSIDVMVMPTAAVVDTSRGVDYRCVTSTSGGTRRYLLEVGPYACSHSAIVQQLLRGNWHVVATTSRLDHLTTAGFEAINTATASQQVLNGVSCRAVVAQLSHDIQVSQEVCQTVHTDISQVPLGTVAMSHNGHLYQVPSRVRLSAPWHVLPTMAGTMAQNSCVARVAVTLSTSRGNVTVSGTFPCSHSATAFNPLIAYPDPRATHMAIEVNGLIAECDLSPWNEGGMAVFINPSLTAIATSAGSVPTGEAVTEPVTGVMTVSATGNALATRRRANVSGCRILALAPACRPIYSGGFGRYPVYLFTTQGVMALPQSTGGDWGEARLITEQVVASDITPVEGDNGVWLVSCHGMLYFLQGSTARLVATDVEGGSRLAWNSVERELWIVSPAGAVRVITPRGNAYSRSLVTGDVYSDSLNALAVTAQGTLVDLAHELPCDTVVAYRSCPIVMHERMKKHLRHITWNLFTAPHGSAAGDVELTLRGERGSSCHGFVVTTVHARGVLAAPLSRALAPVAVRSVRLMLAGTLPTGTMLQPTLLAVTSKK